MVVRVFRNILAKKSVLPSMSNFDLVCLPVSLSVCLSVCVIKSVCSAQANLIRIGLLTFGSQNDDHNGCE